MEAINKGFHKGFNRALGTSLLYTAMELAPYDTGNWASAIRLTKNHWRSIQIKYPVQDIHYLYYVEFGKSSGDMSPRQQANVGSIRFRTVNAFIDTIINYFENDNIPFSGKTTWSQMFSDLTQRKGYNPKMSPDRVDRFGFDYHKYYVGQSRYGIPFDNTRQARRDKSRYYYSRSLAGGVKSRE